MDEDMTKLDWIAAAIWVIVFIEIILFLKAI